MRALSGKASLLFTLSVSLPNGCQNLNEPQILSFKSTFRFNKSFVMYRSKQEVIEVVPLGKMVEMRILPHTLKNLYSRTLMARTS